MDSPYAVPKDRQGVTVHLDEGRAIDGVIFLDADADAHTLHRRMTAFLEGGHAFFPLLTNHEGKPEFVGKAKVRMVEVENIDAPVLQPELVSVMQMTDVAVEFPDGIITRGTLMSEAPAEKARLSDCLNLPGRFLSVKAGKKLLYINKDLVFRVMHDEDGKKEP
jgi:hypothetical protein